MTASTLTQPKAQPVLGTGTFYGTCAQRGRIIRRGRQYTTFTERGERVGRCHCGLHVFLEQAQ